MKTPHFEVHYHQGTHHLAVQAARYAERALERISEILGHLPDAPIQLVISDEVDSANGSAQVIPYNIVHAFASAPGNHDELGDYDNYLWILLVHEITHIVHMDTVSGLPAAINWIFGRTAYPNGAQPTWFVEGLAVFLESAMSSAGRIRSSLFNMYLRTFALSGTFPDIDLAGGYTKAWPQGNLPYLFGGFFLDFLARRYGEQALQGLSHRMSGMVFPWALNVVARKELDQDYPTLYKEWKQSVQQKAAATLSRLEADGLSAARLLTQRGQFQTRPRVSPDSGKVLYYSGPTDRWPTLRLVARQGRSDRQLIEVNNGGGAAFTPDGHRVVFSQADIVDQFYYQNDLHIFDLRTRAVRQLTRGARARSPDISPDGQTVVYIHNRGGRTQLASVSLSGEDQKDLTSFDDGTQVYTPRFSPAGDQVVFSATAASGGRNLMLFDFKKASLRRITNGRFMDIDPVFSPDGARVIFSSDRTGIYNLYSLTLEDQTLVRLTNLATGGFSPDPAPDGSGIAFVLYGKDGFDIAWLDLPLDPYSAGASRESRPPVKSTKDTDVYPVESYSPWGTLLPRSWFPVFGQDNWGATYGALFGGSDVLGKLSYNTQISYGPEENQLYLDLGVRAHYFYPTLSMYIARHVNRYFRDAYVNDRAWWVDKEVITLFFDTAFPFSKIQQSHVLFFNYELRFFDRWTTVPMDPMDTEPVFPDDSNLAWLSIGWSYSNVRSFIDSISPEEGISATISMRYSHPALGSGSHLAEGRFWARTYLPVLRKYRHVLALGLQGGLAVGDARRKVRYSIGGLPFRDPVQDAYFGYRYGGIYLRGYPPGAFSGSVFLLGSAEYRLPLLDIESGFLTLPIFLRQLHAAVFIDAGAAGPDRLDEDMLRIGVGSELRLDMLLAYHLPMTMRLGYGRGLSHDGENNFYLTLGWGF